MKKILAFLIFFITASPSFAIENDVYKWTQFSSTTTVATAAVKLHTVSITTPLSAFTIYDSTHIAGTSVPIAVFTSTMTGTFIFDLQTQNGIQVNEQATGSQVTVTYR